MAKLTSISEVHRGGEHLAVLTIEVDIVDASKALDALNTDGVSMAELERIDSVAAAVAKARKVEADAQDKAAKAAAKNK